MYIKKFLYTDYKLYKQLINDENIPKFLSSIIGSKYCDIRINNNNIITNKKCNIPLYSFKKENNNTLFINGFFYIGTIIDKKETKDNFIYIINETNKIKDHVYKFNKDFSQINLNYFSNIINMKMKNKDQFDKYFFNQSKNLKYDSKRAKELKKVLNDNKINNSDELFKVYEKQMKKDNTKEYRH
jgi:hypothetical protein